MFRLFKLAMYAFVGYALYEFFRGLTSDEFRPRPRLVPGRGGSLQQTSGPVAGSVSGGGEGMETETHGHDGGETRHVVGRGVVSR